MVDTSTSLHPTVMDPHAEHVGSIYAQAALQAAEQEGEASQLLEEFDSFIGDVLSASPELDRLLQSRIVDKDAKAGVLGRVLQGRASRLFLNFLLVVNEHDRLDLLRTILHECHQLYDEQRGRVHVTMRTAVPLPEPLRQRIHDRLREVLQGEPVVEHAVDPALLGGLVLRIGDRVYDGSLSSQLARLREQIIERSFHEIQSGRDRFGDPAGD